MGTGNTRGALWRTVPLCDGSVNTNVHTSAQQAKHQHVRFDGETRDPVSNRDHYTSHMGSTRGAGVHLAGIPFAVKRVFTVARLAQCSTERIDSA